MLWQFVIVFINVNKLFDLLGVHIIAPRKIVPWTIAPWMIAPQIIAPEDNCPRIVGPRTIASKIIDSGQFPLGQYLPPKKIAFQMIYCLHNCPSDNWPRGKLYRRKIVSRMNYIQDIFPRRIRKRSTLIHSSFLFLFFGA